MHSLDLTGPRRAARLGAPWLLALILVGCQPQRASSDPPPAVTPTASLPRTRPAADPVPAPATPAPEGTEALAELLRARHVEDLPDKAVLDRHSGSQEALIWLGAHGEPLATRVRALQLLVHHPDARSAEALRAVLADPAVHPSVRAGAIRGLGGQDLQADDDLRALAEAALDHEDLRVALAAVEVLVAVPAAKPALATAAERSPHPQVRDQARDAL